MPPKGRGRKPQEHRVVVERPLHPYEQLRLIQCMQNSKRLQELGMPALESIFPNINSISHEKKRHNYRNSEESASEYDPSHDDDGEGDMSDDSAKGSKESNTRMLPCHLVELRLGLREFLHNKNVLEIQGQRKALPKLKKWLATLKDTLRLSKKLMALLTWPMEVMPLHGLKRTTRSAMKLMDPSSWRSITTRPMDVMPFRGLMGRTRWEMKGDKCNENEPDALDLFKECHYSKKKKGYTFATEMENKWSTTTEGEEPKSVTDVVADVLAENTKKNQFLQNVGILNAGSRSKVQNMEAQETEKRANAELLSIVNTQREKLDVLSKQLQETEHARIREQEEMKKKQDGMDAKLEFVLSQIRQS